MAKRDNGSGTIRTVHGANGTRYYAYAPAQYLEQEDGTVRCVRQPLGWRGKKTEARELLEEYRRHPSTKFRHTLGALFEEWKPMAYPDIGRDTQNNYNAAWAQICAARPDLPERELRTISTADIRAVYDYWMDTHEITVTLPSGKPRKKKAGPLSRSSMTKIKALLGQIYAYAMANNVVDKNYAALVRIPKSAEDGKGRAFTDAEFAILAKNWQRIPGADSVYALCYLGLRVTEFCRLRPEDYDPVNHTITGGIKTDAGRDRIVPVHPAIIPLVEAWVAEAQPHLYTDRKGKGYTKDSYRERVFKPVLEALGLPSDLTPHSCRHTCATRLAAANARPEDIQRILGHSDYSETANTYVNQDIAALTAAMQRVS